MYKWVGNLMISVLVVGSLFISGSAYASNYSVEIDGKKVDLSVEEIQGRIYLPLTDIVNTLEVKNEWQPNEKRAILYYKDKTITIDVKDQIISDGEKTGNYNIFIKDGSTFVPIRAVSELLGFIVTYEASNLLVSIISQDAIPILMYHSITNDRLANASNISPVDFKEHMYALKKAGYTPIDPNELHKNLNGELELPNNPILITFDDGYEDNYTYAYPILRELNFKATIFIISSVILENKNHSANGSIPKLSWQQIYEMSDLITIQNHTYDSHKKTETNDRNFLGMIATPMKINGIWENQNAYETRITNEIYKSETEIKKHLGYGSVIFSYPYGEFSGTAKTVLKKLGIPLAVTVNKGSVRKEDNRYELKRITVDGNMTVKSLIAAIEKSKVSSVSGH